MRWMGRFTALLGGRFRDRRLNGPGQRKVQRFGKLQEEMDALRQAMAQAKPVKRG